MFQITNVERIALTEVLGRLMKMVGHGTDIYVGAEADPNDENLLLGYDDQNVDVLNALYLRLSTCSIS